MFVIVAIAELLGVLALVPLLVARGTPPPASPRLLLGALAGVSVTIELEPDLSRPRPRGGVHHRADRSARGRGRASPFGLIGGDPLSVALAIGLACALLGGAITAWSSPRTAHRGRADAWRRAAHRASRRRGGRHDAHRAARRRSARSLLGDRHRARQHGPLGRAGGPDRRARLVAQASCPAGSELPTLGARGGGRRGRRSRLHERLTHGGALSIVSAISSLYPVTTIALGRLLQGQRATRTQLAGIVLALGGAALLGASTR